MSRHEMTSEDGRYEVSFGYDRPFDCYFGEVRDRTAYADAHKWEVNGPTFELPEVQSLGGLMEFLKPFVDVSKDQMLALRGERAAETLYREESQRNVRSIRR